MDHSNRSHAILSASGSSRWLNCTPSARLEDGIEDKGSIFAQEGTLAHELSELRLRRKLDMISSADYRNAVSEIEEHEMYNTDMEEQVDKYVQFVLDTFNQLKSEGKHPHIQIESRLDFSDYVPEGFGTGDTLIVANSELYVIDLKYGKGVEVSAIDNPQLRIYGLGGLKAFELSDDIKHVHLVIVQPRLNNISIEEIGREELETWGKEYVTPKADMAFKGEGEFKAGNWCRFCKVAATCKALKEEALATAKVEFDGDFSAPESKLSEQEMIEVYSKVELIQSWINAVKDHVYNSALDGKTWKGFKLVEGRSTRRISDEKKAEEILKAQGLSEEDFTSKKFVGITALEKLMGKKKFNETMAEVIVKPQGKPTLVHESDKRPAMGTQSAKDDFEND